MSGEGKAPAVTHTRTRGGRSAQSCDEGTVQRRVRLRQFLDEPGACRFSGRVGNAGITRGKEFLFLQLQSLPRRVGENDIEAAAGEDFGEF